MKLTLSSYSCSDSPPPDPFWHSFLSSVLTLEELILIFVFFFLCLTCSSSSLFEFDDDSELTLPSTDCIPFLSLFPLALALEGRFSAFLLVKFSNLGISVSAKSWKLLFRHVYSCFWLEHAFSLTECVGGSGCNTGKSPEWVSFSASAMFKRNNNNN